MYFTKGLGLPLDFCMLFQKLGSSFQYKVFDTHDAVCSYYRDTNLLVNQCGTRLDLRNEERMDDLRTKSATPQVISTGVSLSSTITGILLSSLNANPFDELEQQYTCSFTNHVKRWRSNTVLLPLP